MIFKRLFTIFLFLAATPLFADLIQYDQLRVAKIDILTENIPESTSFDPGTVRSRLKTKVGSLFSQGEFDADLKMLASDYERVEPALQVINGELYISLRIWIKPCINSITFIGNEHISKRKLNKTLAIEAGTIYDREEFVQGLNKVKLLYVKKGYFEATVDYRLIPTPDLGSIDIEILIDEGRAGRIKEICFQGLDPCEEEELLEIMATRRYNFLLSWYTGRGCYHPDMIEHDQLVIFDYLQNRGFADAKVAIYTEEAECDDKIVLLIAVEKGACYRIGNITLEGNCLFSHEQIYDLFTIGCGGVYSPARIRETIGAIRELYGSYGYIEAGVDVQVCLHEDCPAYDLAFSVEEGMQFYVGMIRVFGNQCTQPRVILHESLLCPGEVFDIRKLEATEARLRNTGIFSNVNVYAVKSADDECNGILSRDVFIEVEECDTGNLGLFFGFSSLDNLFGGVDVTEQNFNIAGIATILDTGPRGLRGGGEYLHMKANIGTKETNYIIQWSKPYIFDTDWLLGIDAEKSDNRTYSNGYEIKSYGGLVHATYIINEFLKYDMHYRAKHTRTAVRDDSNILLDQLASISGFVSAVGAMLIYDSTDSPRRPTEGFRSRLSYEVAGLGGNFQFMKFDYMNTFYYPVSRKGVFKTRADIHFIHTYGETTATTLPMGERLFLGGETTVRGFRPYIIGPLAGNLEPIGGVSSYLISEEYQHNLIPAPCIDAFFFVDAGFVSLSEFTIGRQAASVGLGLRLEVIRGMPMMFGMGWPIHPAVKLNGQTVSTAQRFFFSMGGCF